MLVPISNTARDYLWGSTTLLAALEGREPSGAPEAEIWYGDHAGCPAVVADGSGQTLDVYRGRSEAPPLSFLLKLLAADSVLSIQVHPSLAQARAGFDAEDAAGVARDAADRNYKDRNHKPELIIALSDEFLALVGVRPLAVTRSVVASLGDGPGLRALAAHLAGEDERRAVRATLEWVLSPAAADDVREITAALRSAVSAETAEIAAIAQEYPEDPGVVVALMMNLVRLRAGEAVFVAAGILHAYVRGLGVEIMAASDNVLRGGLTGKHIDVVELLRIADTTPAPASLYEGSAVGPVTTWAPVGDFTLARVEARSAPITLTPPGDAIVIATRGEVTVSDGDQARLLTPTEGLYIPGETGSIDISGEGEAFVASGR